MSENNITSLMSKLLLRNDSKENWESVNPTLLKGEAGIEFVENPDTSKTSINIKIGDGVTPWNSLQYTYNLADIIAQIPDVDLSSVTNSVTVAESLEGLGAGKVSGDMGIVKTPLYDGSDEFSYTAYVWNGSNWAAMDGNYSAENVFTSKKITLAGNFTSIGNYSKGKELAAGTSLQAILSGMLQTTIQPTKSNPTASISASGDDGGQETGSTYTKPTGTLKVTTGSYTEEGSDTGVKYLADNVMIAYGADPDTATYKVYNSEELGNGGSVSMSPETYSKDEVSAYYTDSLVSYTFSGKAHNEAGNVATDNLGELSNPEIKIAASDITVADKTVSFRGYRKMFCGCTSEELTSTIIRGLSLKNEKASTTAFEVTVPIGATKLVIASPTKSVGKNYTLNKAEMFTMSYEDYTAKFIEKNQIQVADKRGGDNGLQAYNIYVYEFAALNAPTKFRITLTSANA